MKALPACAMVWVALTAVLPAPAQQTVPLPDRSLVKLLPDYSRPVVYGLNKGKGTLPGTLLRLNATNGQVVTELPLGISPTDMAMTSAGDALYAINTGSRTIMKVDLAAYAISAVRSFTTPNTYDPANPLHIAAGRSNLVYFTDGGWSPGVYTFNFASGDALSDFDDDNGAGGLAVTRDGNRLFLWRQYGWGAGNVNSWVTRLDSSGIGLVPLEDSFISWRRDPFDTPLLLNGTETVVFNKQQMFAATNVAVLLQSFLENIYAISLDGAVALGDSQLFNTQTGLALTNFDFHSTVQTLSGDQRRLFRYRSDVSELYVYDMAQLASVSGPTPQPRPADGAVVPLQPSELAWSPSPVALSYRVYFGTNQAQVAAANPTTGEYLGAAVLPSIALSRSMIPGGTYYWRLDVVGFSSTNIGPVWSFTVSPVAVLPAQVLVDGIASFNPSAMTLTITSSVPRAWTAAVGGAGWVSLSRSDGTTPSVLTLTFETAALAAGNYTNQIEITSGGLTTAVPVLLDIRPLNITKMAPDYQRPYVYALQPPPGPGQSGRLLFINTATESVDLALPIGDNPTDLAVHSQEDRLYVANWGRDETYVFDLATRTPLSSLHLGADVYKINAGTAGRIFVEGLDQWITVSAIDTSSGAVVGNLPWPEREGDGEASVDGSVYYHCDNNISDAHIHKFGLTNDVATEVADSTEHPFGSRNLILAPDSSRLFWHGYVYDADLTELGYLGDEIYATTIHGELAFSSSRVFNARNGQTLSMLPVNTSVMAISGDQQKVFLYDPDPQRLRVVPMSEIASVPGPGLVPEPADGSVVSLPVTQLGWSLSPFALSYRVFFGTNQAAVATATLASPLYLGSVLSPGIPLTAALTPGATYYWRVDAVGFNSATPGSVWQFLVAPMVVAPLAVSVSGVTGLTPAPQTLSILSLRPAGIAWAVTSDSSWISAAPAFGSTTGAVTLTFNSTGLTRGSYAGTVRLTANGVSLYIPVSLRLFDLLATQMTADPARPYIYVLHPGSGNFDDAFLLFLNTDTGVIDRVLPIGSRPTDMTVNRYEDRLYVSNWQRNETRVVDLKTGKELPSLHLGTDVYKINAGRAGRVVVEGEDQWITASLIDTTDGSILANAFFREGDGEFDPTGRYYFHCDNNTTGRALTKFDLNNSSFVQLAATGGRSFFGSRNLVMSYDGSRLFWTGSVFDSSLAELGYLGVEVYGCSTNGSIAFSDRAAYDTRGQQLIFNLPFTTRVMAVDRADRQLWYYDPGTARLASLPLQTIRSPSITQQPSDTSFLAGGSANLSVGAMGFAPLAYQWLLNGTNLPGETNFFLALNNAQPDRAGSYQVIVNNPYGSVTSVVAHVVVLAPPAITQQPTGSAMLAGGVVSLVVQATGSAPLLYQWSFEGVNLPGATSSTLVLSNLQAAQEGIYRVRVSNAAGSTDSVNALVRVLPSRPMIVSDLTNQIVEAGADAQLSVRVTGSAPFSYQWLFNGHVLTDAAESTLSLSNVQAGQAGTYQAVIANSLGSATSAEALLSVKPAAPHFVVQPFDASGPIGVTVTLSSLARGSDPIRYQWKMNGTNLPEAVSPSLALSNAALAQSGPYVVVAVNTQGGATSSIANVIITGAPPTFVQQPASVSLGVGATLTLTALATGSTPLTYQWYFEGASLAGKTNSSLVYSNVTSSQAGRYFVMASNAVAQRTSATANVVVAWPPTLVAPLTNQAVEAGADVLLSAAVQGASPLTYAWQFRGRPIFGATGPSLRLTNVQPTQAGAYRLTIGNQFGLAHSTMALTVFPAPGDVLAWGDNAGGQTNVPRGLGEVVAVAGGDFHSVALGRDGTLTAWGYDGDGQATTPPGLTDVVAIAAGAAHNLAVRLNGSIIAWGRHDFGQTSIPPGATSAVAVAAGDAHSLALLQDGSVLAWGDNTYGQCNVPQKLGFVVAIAAGRNHSVALRNTGTIEAWGLNAQTPPGLTDVKAIAAGYLHTLALRNDGTVIAWGDDSFGQSAVPLDLTDVSAIAAGDFHSLALRVDGTLVGWGDNSFGQLNFPDSLTHAITVGAGYYHGLVVVPPMLGYRVQGSALILWWQGQRMLQRAAAWSGPYVDFTATSPYTNHVADGVSAYFRLRATK